MVLAACLDPDQNPGGSGCLSRVQQVKQAVRVCVVPVKGGGGTCQSVGLTDALAQSEQREGVDEVHAEVEDALEQHHHQAQLHSDMRGSKTNIPAFLCGGCHKGFVSPA